MSDQPPAEERRRSADELAWRVGELERTMESIRARLHTIETTGAANKHLLDMIVTNTKRIQELAERDAVARATTAGYREAVTEKLRETDRGLSRWQQATAIFFGAAMLAAEVFTLLYVVVK